MPLVTYEQLHPLLGKGRRERGACLDDGLALLDLPSNLLSNHTRQTFFSFFLSHTWMHDSSSFYTCAQASMHVLRPTKGSIHVLKATRGHKQALYIWLSQHASRPPSKPLTQHLKFNHWHLDRLRQIQAYTHIHTRNTHTRVPCTAHTHVPRHAIIIAIIIASNCGCGWCSVVQAL